MSSIYSKSFAAALFDMDGTLINSMAAAERVWGTWARKHGLDLPSFLPTIHGRRVSETIGAQNLPDIDVAAESAWITEQEMLDVGGIVQITGAKAFLESIPADKLAIVTSAPRALAERRLIAAGLAVPRVIVAAEDVVHGKPAPDCFILAAKRLGVAVSDCVIVEDAPAGIAAAEASGATVVVITETHHVPMRTPHATLPSYADVRMTVLTTGRLQLGRLA